MRVTGQSIERNILYDIARAQTRLQRLQDQAASGKKVSKPEDDPVVAQRSVLTRHFAHQNQQYLRNLEKARFWLTETEQSLQQLTSVLSRAQELSIYGNNIALGKDERNAIAKEVQQLLDEVDGLDRKLLDGRPLLSGPMPKWVVGSGVEMASEDMSRVLTAIKDALMNLKTGLENSSATSISDAGQQIVSLRDQVLATMAANGAKVARLDTLEEKMKSLDIEYQKSISVLEDVDLTETVVRLKSAEAAYQAALGAAARLIQPSLLDYLR